MSSPYVFCSKCGAANGPNEVCCYMCKQPLLAQPAQSQTGSQRRLSRRAILTLLGTAFVPASVGATYITYRKLTNPHIVTYAKNDTIVDAAWSPDGTRVATALGSNGGEVRIWDARTGETLHSCTLEHPVDGVAPLNAVWSADGKHVLAFVALANVEDLKQFPGKRYVEIVQVWDATTGQRVQNIPVTHALSADSVEEVVWQEYSANQSLVGWALNERYLAMEVEEQGTYSVFSVSYKGVEVWEIASGKKVATLDADPRSADRSAPEPHYVAWAPDKVTLAVIGEESMHCEIWEMETGSKRASLMIGDQSSVTGGSNKVILQEMAWASDSKRLAILKQDLRSSTKYICEIWNISSGTLLRRFELEDMTINRMVWSPDGQSITLGTTTYDVQTGRIVATYVVKEQLNALDWSPDGKYVVVSSYISSRLFPQSYLYLFDAVTGRQLARYEEIDSITKQLTWSPDGKYLLRTGSGVEIWERDLLF